MLSDSQLSTASLDFLQQKDINTIYLYADRDSWHMDNLLVDTPDVYKSFISDAHSRGMKVYALFGDDGRDTEGWVLSNRHDEALTAFNTMLTYNKNAQPNERFDGANLDIEPHLLSTWATDTVSISAQWLDLSHKFMLAKQQYLNDIGQSDPSQFVVGPASPFWLETVPDISWDNPADAVTGPVSKPLYEHLIDVYDYLTILDYRDFALTRGDRDGDDLGAGRDDGIVRLVIEELEYAETVGKPIVLGVETIPLPSDIPHVSFFEDGPDVLEDEIALALNEFQLLGLTAFSGFALHDFIWYQRLINDGPFITGIPEPSSGLLLFAGTVLLAPWRRTRQASTLRLSA